MFVIYIKESYKHLFCMIYADHFIFDVRRCILLHIAAYEMTIYDVYTLILLLLSKCS